MKTLMGKISYTIILAIAFGGFLFVAGILSVVDFIAPASYLAQLTQFDDVSAEAWLVFDVETERVIYSHNENEALPIASITKLQSAMSFTQHDNLWATTTITWNDVVTDGRAGKLLPGEVYDYHTLFFPLLLESSNDAAVALLHGDASLLDHMNDAVGDLEHTHFADVTGLSAKNVSTPHDLAHMLHTAYTIYPHILDITALDSYINERKGWLNNNPFAHDPTYRGGKHGYTPEAGHTFAGVFTETLKNGTIRQIGYVVLGSTDLSGDVALLRERVQTHVSFR